MIYRLRNQAIPERTLCLTGETWFNIIDLAELYGWNPFGTIEHGKWTETPLPQAGYYLGSPLFTLPQEKEQEGLHVITEDALNLADALEQAFFEYEPQRVPDSFYLFEPVNRSLDIRLSIGAITETMEFCRQGAFHVECRQRLQ